uniref:Fucolectin tachylectin-4 pentraxin-1 domain-containing protein n=1 Tax=Podarcis muralis TaxID=64176 RepID=A0A670J2A7_PODMU
MVPRRTVKYCLSLLLLTILPSRPALEVSNVALTGEALQSSTYNPLGGAMNAIDGSLVGVFTEGSCTHTDYESNPWWTVDLQAQYQVAHVSITNREDCCAHRINGAEIRVGDSTERGGTTNPRCATISSLGAGETETFYCESSKGQFVTVTLPGKEYLTLCEVQVFGCKIESPDTNVALAGEASQSSTYSSLGVAGNAIDGSTSSNFNQGSCTHTNSENNPWWMVDLKAQYQVLHVTITNRKDCCAQRLNGAEIRVGDSAERGGTTNPRCATIGSLGAGKTDSFNCEASKGRYVTVTLPRKEYLTLCEVQVFGRKIESPDTNVALAGEASQSSTYNSLGAAGNAIDGSTSSNFNQGSCTHTNSENNPWWMVDLKAQYHVLRVTITNRKDCCAQRLNGAEIRIGDSAERGGTTNPRCATIGSLGAGETETFYCESPKGQFVTVTLPGKEYLTLCEVQVFGCKIESPDTNVALAGEASQSSTYSSLGAAGNAIDGSTASNFNQGSCTHTNSENNPWWMVDLKAQYQVLRVTITNRKDCCAQRLNGAEIRVGDSAERGGTTNPRCATIGSLGAGETDSFNCEASKGRYVTVTLPRKEYLTLCEVQVFGRKIESPGDEEGTASGMEEA